MGGGEFVRFASMGARVGDETEEGQRHEAEQFPCWRRRFEEHGRLQTRVSHSKGKKSNQWNF